MLEELRRKTRDLGLENVTPLLITPESWTLPNAAYDLVFSSMVLHHIAATEILLYNLSQTLRPGGTLALADLQKEDGTFHDDPTGVAHHGLDPRAVIILVAGLGFTSLETRTVHTIFKARGENEHGYPVFLLTGQKPR